MCNVLVATLAPQSPLFAERLHPWSRHLLALHSELMPLGIGATQIRLRCVGGISETVSALHSVLEALNLNNVMHSSRVLWAPVAASDALDAERLFNCFPDQCLYLVTLRFCKVNIRKMVRCSQSDPLSGEYSFPRGLGWRYVKLCG